MASPSVQTFGSPARFPTEPVPGRPKHPVRAYFTSDEGKSVKAGATCNYCGLHLSSSKVDTLQNHIFSCPHAPKDARAELEARRAEIEAKRAASSPASGDAAVSKKKSTLQKPKTAFPNAIRLDTSAAVQRKWSLLLCRFLVLSGVAFLAVDHPAFKDLMQAVAPGWQVPGSQTLLSEILPAEYTSAVAQQSRILSEHFLHATLCIDSYLGNPLQSLYSIVIQRQDGKSAFLDIVDVAEMRFAVEQLRDVVAGHITQTGPVKLGAVVTTGSAVMKQMFELLLQIPSCRHLLPLRCMASSFALTAKALMSHPWAAGIAAQAHQLSTHFQSTPQLRVLFETQRLKHGLTLGLVSAFATRLDSVAQCIQSVWENKRAFLDVGQMTPELATLVGNLEFWKNLEVLALILSPITGVLTALQRGGATLGDTTRYFLFLARSLHLHAPSAPPDYGNFCFATFGKFWQELDRELCQLALFLDPRFKGLASARDWDGVLRKALSILKLCGYNLASLLAAKQLMLEYRDDKQPFQSHAGIKKSKDALLWWKGLNLAPDNPLKALAVRLITIRPYAADVERALIGLAWTTPPQPVEPQPVQQLKVLEVLKLHYSSDTGEGVGGHSEIATEPFSYMAAMGGESEPALDQGAGPPTSAESLEAQLVAYHKQGREPPSIPGSFAGGVLFGVYNLEDPALDPKWVPQAVAPLECNLSGDGAPNEDIDIEAILAVGIV